MKNIYIYLYIFLHHQVFLETQRGLFGAHNNTVSITDFLTDRRKGCYERELLQCAVHVVCFQVKPEETGPSWLHLHVSLSRKGLVSVTGMLRGTAFLKHKNLVSLQAERSKWMKYHRESYLCLFTAPHNSHNLKTQYANQCLQGTKKYSFLGHQECPIVFDLHLRLSIYLLKEILNVACMY